MTQKSDNNSHSNDIDACLYKYLEYKERIDEYEKKLQKYRNNLKTLLKKTGEKKYVSDIGSVTVNEATKSTLGKKDVPNEFKYLWDKYSKKTTYDIVSVRGAKKIESK